MACPSRVRPSCLTGARPCKIPRGQERCSSSLWVGRGSKPPRPTVFIDIHLVRSNAHFFSIAFRIDSRTP